MNIQKRYIHGTFAKCVNILLYFYDSTYKSIQSSTYKSIQSIIYYYTFMVRYTRGSKVEIWRLLFKTPMIETYFQLPEVCTSSTAPRYSIYQGAAYSLKFRTKFL